MSFDYFNTSHLGFGSKITKAFLQLNRLLTEGEDNLQDLFKIYEIYSQYIDRNYPAPFPTRADAPVRAKELYDLINDGNLLRSVYLDGSGNLNVTVSLYKRISNRFTIATGSTSLKKGFAFCQDSVSNKQYSREIQFVENYNDGKGNFLFEFRIDSKNNINIVGDTERYYIPSTFDHITTMSKDQTIFTNSRIDRGDTYTATDYETILLVGYAYPEDGEVNPDYSYTVSRLMVKINGVDVMKVGGWLCRQFGVVYLKPGDRLSADCKTAFKINYTSGEPVPPQPPEPPTPPEPGEDVSIDHLTTQWGYQRNNHNDDLIWNSEVAVEGITGAQVTESTMTQYAYLYGQVNITLSDTIPAEDNYILTGRVSGGRGSTSYADGFNRLKSAVLYYDDKDTLLSTTYFDIGVNNVTLNEAVPNGTSKITIRWNGNYFTGSLNQLKNINLTVSNLLLEKQE